MAVYLALVFLVPRVVTKPTGIKIFDDLVLFLISQKGSLVSGVILVGIVVYLSKYLEEYMSTSESVQLTVQE